MQPRMSHFALVSITLLLLNTSAQDTDYEDEFERIIRPLPGVNQTLVSQFKIALEAISTVGIRLQTVLQEEKDQNFLVSPVSAAVIIAQLILGSEGVFRNQLVDLLSLPYGDYNNHNDKVNATSHLPFYVLHMQLSKLLKSLESSSASKKFILTEKSAMFISKKISLKDQFKSLLDLFYEARTYDLDFTKRSAQRTINSWVHEQTNGLIDKILHQAPSPQTQAIVANAIYFKSDWEYPFADILNKNGSFSVNQNKQVQVTYMRSFFEEILYAESQQYDLIALPYKNEELGFYIMLPKPDNPNKYDMKNFIQAIKFSETFDVLKNARRRDVIVKLPKMTVSNTFSILNGLKKYRAYRDEQADKINITSRNVFDKLEDKLDVFNNFTADMEKEIFLTNAADQILVIDDIVQHVIVNVNEKGTEAAAVSASTVNTIGGQINFIVDRPFVFFIQHEATSATLFWGSITDPTA